jgi:hypothetical protein
MARKSVALALSGVRMESLRVLGTRSVVGGIPLTSRLQLRSHHADQMLTSYELG